MYASVRHVLVYLRRVRVCLRHVSIVYSFVRACQVQHMRRRGSHNTYEFEG